MRHFVVSVRCEAFSQEFVGNYSSLWETIHAAADLHVDVAVVDFVMEVVGIEAFFGDEFDGHPRMWQESQFELAG